MPKNLARTRAKDRVKEIDQSIEIAKHQESAAMRAQARRPKVEKPTEVVTDWFLLRAGDDDNDGEGYTWRMDFKCVYRGTKVECLKYLTTYKKKNPRDNTEIFLAHGMKVVGY